MIWWVKNKLKSEDGEKEVQYEMKGKLENTENTIKEWIKDSFYLDIKHLSRKNLIYTNINTKNSFYYTSILIVSHRKASLKTLWLYCS